MDFEVLKEVKLDFHDSKYVAVNAKQFDGLGRYVEITCSNNGKAIRIEKNKYFAFVRYRRADGLGIVDSCKIMDNGKVRLCLTKKMLDVEGKCYADIILVESNSTRSPVADNGFFVVDHIYNESEQSLELMFSPSLNFECVDGVLHIKSVNQDGNAVSICQNPEPFASFDGNGTLTIATINKSGEITVGEANILSTMGLWINVIGSSFYGNCMEIIR